MEKLKHIDEVIQRKQAAVDPHLEIITPEQNLPAEQQADWLISVLCKMYTQHGITKRREPLIKDIQSGDCRVWFAFDDGEPIASAAIVKQNDGSREIGRAVSLRDKVGGLLMLLAAQDHLASSDSPLVAEVRISANFFGVPSGEATQRICLEHIGLLPHAVVPAFNHGNPVRQESFLFSSSCPLEKAKPMALPEDHKALNLLFSTVLPLVSDRFFTHPLISSENSCPKHTGWLLEQTSPFSIMVPDGSVTSLEKTAQAAESQSAFTLVPVETVPESIPAIIDCLNFGFVPCGIDRNLGESGRPVLLLGKLRKGTLLAPITLIQGVLADSEAQAVVNIDQAIRNSINL